MKILTVLGARPQFIKASVLSKEIQKHSSLNEIIVHTGQHFDSNMSNIFFEEMEIPQPSYNLNVNGLSHGAMTGQMLEKIEKIILFEKPDLVLVYGDTNSTFAGALASKKLHISVAHVEAGLRSFNLQMPEEINRILTDRISDILFCPTDNAVNNLKNEGFKQSEYIILNSGDVMEDAAIYFAEKALQKSEILNRNFLQKGKFILATIHRAENTNNILILKSIVKALNELNTKFQVVVPLHPRTKNIIYKNGIDLNFTTIEPVGYFDMLNLLSNCSVVITDSGGLQKEAFYFKKYCCTIREETEWVELVDHGFNFIVGSNQKRIVEKTKELIDKKFPENINLYGNGNACKTICQALLSFNS
jgi:UDP-GlcNAc3NAcA epimerase